MGNNNLIRSIIIFTLFLLNSIFVFGQNNITISSNVDSTLTGYDIPLNIKINPNSSEKSFHLMILDPATFLKLYDIPYQNHNIDTIPREIDYEITDYGNWKGDSNKLITEKTDTNRIRIKIWDAGQYIVLPAQIKKTDGVIDTIYPDRYEKYPSFIVYGSSTPNDTLRDFTPIKDIIREEKNWQDYKTWIISVLVLILILLAIFIIPKLRKTKEKGISKVKKKIKVIPAHIIALKKLEKLKSEKIWKTGKFKEFQSKLTYTLREYLERRYKIQALEQTTGEIVNSLGKYSIEENDISSLKNILQIADLVKFAKAKPGEDINEEFLNETFEFVNKTKEKEDNNNV